MSDKYDRPVSQIRIFNGKPTLVQRIEDLEKQVTRLTESIAFIRSALEETHHGHLLQEPNSAFELYVQHETANHRAIVSPGEYMGFSIAAQEKNGVWFGVIGCRKLLWGTEATFDTVTDALDAAKALVDENGDAMKKKAQEI